MKYLVTGANGFVGQYFIKYLVDNFDHVEVIGTYRNDIGDFKNENVQYERINLQDQKAILSLLDKYKPEFIVHLAAESSVGYSWLHPVKSFNNNVNIFLHLVEAIRILKFKTRILSVGSSESYGNVHKDEVPLKEAHRLNPISPYAVARVAQEMLSKVYINGYGLDIILTRSFNHIGPGQDSRFVIPSFVQQVIDRKQSNSLSAIETGNLLIVRDFLDVRDVVVAYNLLLEKGQKGEIYNICTSRGHKLQEILDIISEILKYKITTKVNPKFIRPNDNLTIIGDNSKLKDEIGWTPKITIRQSLVDIIGNIQKK
jgi:GDP-4-dehydro-6-deoxy-D-mannose reductase